MVLPWAKRVKQGRVTATYFENGNQGVGEPTLEEFLCMSEGGAVVRLIFFVALLGCLFTSLAFFLRLMFGDKQFAVMSVCH